MSNNLPELGVRKKSSLVFTSYRDLLRQAVSAMRHDARRTLLTMAGMAWGIATVVLLLAYGNGFGNAITNIFASFGATAVGVFPGRTSLQAGGNKAGTLIRFTNDDMELMRKSLGDLEDSGVVVVGSVKEVSDAFDRHRVFVAPLRFGAGIKG